MAMDESTLRICPFSYLLDVSSQLANIPDQLLLKADTAESKQDPTIKRKWSVDR